jgi:hypothetical protein
MLARAAWGVRCGSGAVRLLLLARGWPVRLGAVSIQAGAGRGAAGVLASAAGLLAAADRAAPGRAAGAGMGAGYSSAGGGIAFRLVVTG